MRILRFSSILFILPLLFGVLSSCSNNDDEDQRAIDEALILEYIADNGLDAVEGPEDPRETGRTAQR